MDLSERVERLLADMNSSAYTHIRCCDIPVEPRWHDGDLLRDLIADWKKQREEISSLDRILVERKFRQVARCGCKIENSVLTVCHTHDDLRASHVPKALMFAVEDESEDK